MTLKRRRSSAEAPKFQSVLKKQRTGGHHDHLSDLSDELLIRILHCLPIHTLLLQCQRLSHRFYTLAGDSQLWKNLYYDRFVLPRALRIPGIKAAQTEDVLHFSSRRSKWLEDVTLVNRIDGKKTNWKKQYKLRHNWSIGACEVQEIHIADRPPVPSMLVKLAEGVVVTADREDGLRAWDLKEKALIAKYDLDADAVPTCLAIDEQDSDQGLGIAVGFIHGGWGTWKLNAVKRTFMPVYRHPASSNGMLSAVAYAKPYILTITNAQLLSLYTFDPKHSIVEIDDGIPSLNEADTDQAPYGVSPINLGDVPPTCPEIQQSSSLAQPHLLASLKSHTSWPPLSLSIRSTPSILIASIAYSIPTYLSGYTVGLQELHLSLSTGLITFSRLASALPNGFTSLSPVRTTPLSPTSGSGLSSPGPNSQSNENLSRPTTLSYSHPYILATHSDNTLTLYLCQSTPSSLSISTGTKLWGHTSSVSSAEITPRGKAVSVSTRGNELRVWELEGGSGSKRKIPGSNTRSKLSDSSVRIRPETKGRGDEAEIMHGNDLLHMRNNASEIDTEARKQWVGFDDEVVIVLKESEMGTQALMVYDFT